MKIAHTFPPNYLAICKRFPAVKKMPRVIFTYGDTLYIPAGLPIYTDLLKHEETHERQQAAMGIEAWWEQYLKDDKFRLAQELEAYRNQYQWGYDYGRRYRERLLDNISNDLSGPIYGKMITKAQAIKLITEK